MRVQPGTGRIYQLSPTSRMGSTPLQPRQTAPLAVPAKPAQEVCPPGVLGGFKGFLNRLKDTVSSVITACFSLFSFGAKDELQAGRRPLSTGGGGQGTV